MNIWNILLGTFAITFFSCQPIDEKKRNELRPGTQNAVENQNLPQGQTPPIGSGDAISNVPSPNTNGDTPNGDNQNSTGPDLNESGAFFGTAEDVSYATDLWLALRRANLVGPDSVGGALYNGSEPHGAVREITSHKVTVRGHKGRIFVKKNYGGENVSLENVSQDRDTWLKAVTVIFEREDGFDEDVNNTFWVKYKSNGDLDVNPANAPLAGRIGKGADAGCLACHGGAKGGDFYFWND